MKVKIKDGGIYRTKEIDSSDYGIYLERGYTEVVDKEPIITEKPVEKVEEVIEEKVDELPKSKKKKK